MNKTLRYVMTLLLAGLVLMLGAPAASAHEGPIKLEVAGDGGQNVNVLATWKEDGHPVTEIVEATLVATSTDGRSFGPVPLRSSPEGQNLYHLAEPLPAGEWKVTVTATEPSKASLTTKVNARDIAAGSAAAAAPLGPERPATASAQDAGVSFGTPLQIGVIALAALAAVAVGIALIRRGRPGIRR
ncbi:hypothetical protein GCM10009530_65700 [Microbispora corallina]|uniref:YtkA-like domain-containing protein n=1 Tax=Microbispora corallina TaxID=83302 RepID=A0ABQ4G929_9ACTN|nr:hypothetical protein [Microbispora corallina]GIH43586.1 hypothetical protein Mco01_65860 [Microbispora corallina]